MKHMKRILSFALVLVMVLSCMPIQALATENTETAYVAINKTTGKGYDSLLVAMSECRKGETVVLQKDASEMQVLVPADGILDLNGCTLETEYMSCFGDLIDSSDDNSGLLKVNEDYFLIRGDNKQLPIKDGTGFRFVEITKINTKMLTPTKFVFQPLFEAAALDLVAKGGDVTGLTVQVLVGWKQNDGYRTQEFVYNDDLLTQFLGSYNAATGKYGKMFTLTLNNVDGIEELSFAAVLASSTKVTISSATEKEEVTGNVTTDANNQVVNQVILDNGSASAVVSTGTQLVGGTSKVTLSATEMEKTTSNVTLGANEKMQSMNVHVEGVSIENTVPILVTLDKLAPEFLNQGNLKLYHVENGETVEMTRVYALSEVDAHNEFYYDIATGTVTMALATFSEIAVVSEEPKWEGDMDITWYNSEKTAFEIYNADQLFGLSAIVGGMVKDNNGETIQDSFAGKTVKLMADIDLNDKEEDGKIFYPIGYNSNDGKYEKTNVAVTTGFYNFCGTFDGNGHTVSNFYQNTWEMKGDNNYYDATLQYYRDGMGLFGRVYKGTIKNLTVENFSSDGEYTTTGCIAAYADGATFENISIFNCNPRVYNIGNGGIVGCVGWYAREAGLKTTFSNITVDNSNKISALWGSYDVACGGIVGQYYPTSGQSSANYPVNAGIHFENCHVAAQMDVYNDVCANYQYYAYRYTGMLIGSIRENVTENGHSYPKMDGITASGCTVHFGTWNDYYYCELVDNTTASYTHDYQMSRLTEIKAIDGTTITYLDGTTGTVPASGRANYVIVDYTKGHGTENATCYHFLNGEVWTHDMGGIQTGIDENGDGQDDLKEDKQHIYLEFNNLVTGYGWGVTTKAVGDLDGVKILDRVEADSVVKFNGTANGQEFITGTTVTIGQLFQAKDQNEVKIDPTKVQVFVSAVGDNSDVSATYTANTTDWTQGTLTFSGAGAATITITDYYFCTPTTITVTVEDNQPVEKFDKLFNKDFLYRVGNADKSPVGIGYLFKAKNGVEIGTVSVTIENVAGNASGVYTAGTPWTSGTIQFSGTGVVKVTITDNDYCTPTVLYLEVVDAKNVTGVESATANNVVLLNDTSASSLTVSNGYAFYGNGFTIAFNGDGSYRSAALSYGFVTLEGGTLDNVQIKCRIFPKSYLYTNEMTAGSDGRYPYGYSAVVASNGSVISNCYIYGARNNIHATAGNVMIKDTVLECGSVANIHCAGTSSDLVTLHNVTTIQYQTTDDFNANSKVLGFGVLVGTNESTSNASIKLTGDFKQYNWVTSDDTSVSNTYAKEAIAAALKETAYQYTIGGENTVNMGIVILNQKDCTIFDERDNKAGIPYAKNNITISLYTGQVYSIVAGSSEITAETRYSATADRVIPYAPTQNNVIVPSVSYNNTNDAISLENKFEQGKWQTSVIVDLDNISGGSYTFSFANLIANKYGKNLTFTIKDSSGNIVDNNATLNLNQFFTGEYTLYVEDNQIYNAQGAETGVKVTHEIPLIVRATKTSIDPPKFAGIGSGVDGSIRLVASAGGNWRPAYPALEGVSVTYWSASENQVKTIELATLTEKGTINGQVWTYTCDDFTLKITGGPVHSDGSKKLYPKIAGNILYFYSDKDHGTGTTARAINLEYVFTDKNASTTVGQAATYNGGAIATVQYANLPERSWSSFQEGKVEEVSSGSSTPCVTPDTLITLADGTQVRVDELTGNEMLLVWNLKTGKYEAAPIVFVDSDAEMEYEIIHLYFSNGSDVKVIYEHGFFDLDLGKYVYIDATNYADYVGHRFVTQGDIANGTWNVVTLDEVVIEKEVTTAWSPVTFEHLCYYTNGVLSMPGGIEGLFNIFEVDTDTMRYDEAKMQADIDTYGLFTLEDFGGMITEDAFLAFNGAYLKVAMGKGLLTWEDIAYMAERYIPLM